MTIDEAILVLENEVRVAIVHDRSRDVKAFRLGIEALKYLKNSRVRFPARLPVTLPGETIE